MVKKVEMFTASDGRSFVSEESAIRYEAITEAIKVFPEFAMIQPRIEGSITSLALALYPLACYMAKTTPEVIGENHPEDMDHDALALAILSCRFCASTASKGLNDLWYVMHQPGCPEVINPTGIETRVYREPPVADDTVSVRLNAAIQSMRRHTDLAKPWLTANGFENIREFCQRSSGHWLNAWENHLWEFVHSESSRLERGPGRG